jgi:hypothetical protein
MGGCHSAIAATKLKILRRGGRGAAAVLPVTNHDGPCCSSDHGSKEKKKKKKGARKGRKRASILGDAGTFDPDFSRRYRLGAELGRGEFGVTRRCEDAATGEALACKTIRRKRLLLRLAGPDATDVQREVEITRRMSEVSGGRVACLREACEDDDGVHLVMELCEGGELFDRIFERKHYSERAAAKLARTIVEVVQVTVCLCLSSMTRRGTERGRPHEFASVLPRRSRLVRHAAVPRERSDAQGPEAGELPVREQVGGVTSQGHRLRPLRVLQAWYDGHRISVASPVHSDIHGELCRCRRSVHRSGWQRVLHGSRGSQEKLWARDRRVERWCHPAHPSLRVPSVLGR